MTCCYFANDSQKKYKINRNFINIITGIFAIFPLAVVSSVQALQVKVNPQSPQLGDTISVVINLQHPVNGSKVTVTNVNNTYPAFEIAPSQYRAFIPTTPLENPGVRTIQVSGEGEVQNVTVNVQSHDFPVQHINLPPSKAGLEATDNETKRIAEFLSLRTPQKYWNGIFQRPNAGPITTIYGVRRYYNGKFAKDYYHRGVDYAGDYGSPVVAPAAGRVSLVGRESQGFRIHGNVVGLDHGQGVASIFMHLSRIYVKEGDLVKAGQTIGAVGSTGAATGPHLHWGLYVNGKAVDPVPWRTHVVN